MIPKEILKKIRHIEISTSRMVTDIFAGEYHSVFKGQGMEFDEVREYQMGDDIRSIDWNVTARVGKPHIKQFIEEREMSVMIMVDVSQSCQFGTVKAFKSDLVAEISAVLAYSAIRNNDKVGLIMFSDKIEKYVPPNKGVRHVLRVIREILYFKPESKGSDFCVALEYLNRVMTRRTVSFFISDFILPLDEKQSVDQWDRIKKTLAIVNKKHDLIIVTLNDPREQTLENYGMMSFEDAETGQVVMIDSGSRKVRKIFAEKAQQRIKDRTSIFRLAGIDHIDIVTDQPYTKPLIKFFKTRKQRIPR